MKPATATTLAGLTAGEVLAKIDELEIDLTLWINRNHPPRRASCFVGERHVEEYGHTSIEAVEKLLAKLEGGND